MGTLETLEKAKELLAKPDSWTKESHARDDRGFCVWPNDPGACQFCLLGALAKVQGVDPGGWSNAHDRIRDQLSCSIALFNDSAYTTHARVLLVLDNAITAEKEELERVRKDQHPGKSEGGT